MSRHFTQPTIWQRLTGRGRQAALRQPDAADLGTCFGMEYWLDEAQSLPPQDLKAATTSPAATRGRSRLSRWWRAMPLRG